MNASTTSKTQPSKRNAESKPSERYKIMFLDKEEIFEVVKANTLKVLPDLLADDVTIDKNLSDLGANSVDRVEVVIYSLEQLSLKVPTSEIA